MSEAHSDEVKRTRMVERFWSKVGMGPNGCWVWLGSCSTDGYGQLSTPHPQNSTVRAHRYGYELQVGPIPEGMHLDHLCRNIRCVRGDHLEPVTNRENIQRAAPFGTLGKGERNKTHCPLGHPYDEANTYIHKSTGGRRCRACNRVAMQKRTERKKAS